MAQRLTSFTLRDGRERYPWDEWEDGSVWRVAQGTDFRISADAFRRALRNRANYRRTYVTVRTAGAVVEFQFRPTAAS